MDGEVVEQSIVKNEENAERSTREHEILTQRHSVQSAITTMEDIEDEEPTVQESSLCSSGSSEEHLSLPKQAA